MSASEWKHWITEDVKIVQTYLSARGVNKTNIRLVDIVVPSYRIPEQKLLRIIAMTGPDNWRSVFIIIIDNPDMVKDIEGGCEGLEKRLASIRGHNVRVRQNPRN